MEQEPWAAMEVIWMYVDDEQLAKIDEVRIRTGLSYTEAREILQQAQWNLVDALVMAEQRRAREENSWEVRGREVVARVKELIRQGNVTRIRIKHKDEVLLELPVTLGVVGTVLLPKLAVLAAGVCLLTKCTIEVERKPEVEHEVEVQDLD